MILKLRNYADRLISLSATIGSIGLIVEVGIILVDVIGRAFGSPLYGSQDLETMTMVLLVFGGMALCDRRGGHIAVDIFERKFPDWLNKMIDILSALLGAFIFIMIAWTVYESSQLSVMLNLSTNLLRLPKSIFQWALCGLALMTAFAMLLRAAELGLSNRDIRQEGEI